RGYRGRSALPEPPAVLALVVVEVLAAPDRGPPPLVVAVPVDRQRQAVLEARARLPPELAAELVGGQRVAPVVAGPVGDVLDERLVAVGQRQDPPNQVEVRGLVRAAGVVDLAGPTVAQHRVDRPREVLHEEPVADLEPV